MPLKTKPPGRDYSILLLFDSGVDINTIAKALGFHTSTVRRILRLHRGNGGQIAWRQRAEISTGTPDVSH